MFQTIIVEKIIRQIVCLTYLCFGNHAVYEIMCKNVIESERPQI